MEELEQLLEKLRNGTCTPEEIRRLKMLFDHPEKLPAFLDHELSETNFTLDDLQQKSIWSNIHQHIHHREPEKSSKLRAVIVKPALRWAGVAAAIFLFFVLWRNWETAPMPPSVVLIENTQPNNIKEIKLPDGSRVWLNQKSRISYASTFGDRLRLVELKGEAFFEVKKDEQHPFIVQTAQVKTRVLGTSFNVRAYAADDSIHIALVEGKIALEIFSLSDTTTKYLELAPGRAFSFHKKQETFATGEFSNDDPYLWKNGILYFDGADVYTVTETLQRWYDVRFILQQDSLIKSELVYRYDTRKFAFEEVLSHITEVTDYEFKLISNGEYLVTPK